MEGGKGVFCGLVGWLLISEAVRVGCAWLGLSMRGAGAWCAGWCDCPLIASGTFSQPGRVCRGLRCKGMQGFYKGEWSGGGKVSLFFCSRWRGDDVCSGDVQPFRFRPAERPLSLSLIPLDSHGRGALRVIELGTVCSSPTCCEDMASTR